MFLSLGRPFQAALLVLLLFWFLPTQATPAAQRGLQPGAQIGDYVGEDVMIPMRDGVHLHAEVWRPKGTTDNLPIILQRSPYGFGVDKVARSFKSEYKELAEEGFIFVLEDIRGRFGSEGEFVMLRPKSATRDGVDESSDTYDSIDWLVKRLPRNNGAVFLAVEVR
jgi:predicted acyl esterase